MRIIAANFAKILLTLHYCIMTHEYNQFTLAPLFSAVVVHVSGCCGFR